MSTTPKLPKLEHATLALTLTSPTVVMHFRHACSPFFTDSGAESVTTIFCASGSGCQWTSSLPCRHWSWRARISKCDLSEKFCHQRQIILVNHSGPQLCKNAAWHPLCSCSCKSGLCKWVANICFAIQKIRKLKPPKGKKNVRAADFQIMLSSFSSPAYPVSIHKSATETGVAHENRGPFLLSPLCRGLHNGSSRFCLHWVSSVSFCFFDRRMQESWPHKNFFKGLAYRITVIESMQQRQGLYPD